MSTAINPYASLKAAADGDPAALRKLANAGARLAIEDGDDLAITEALLLARLAYARTQSQEDAGLLLCCLGIAADLARAVGEHATQAAREAESIALLSLLADEGVRIAEDMLPNMVAGSMPAAARDAKAIREMMTEGQ